MPVTPLTWCRSCGRELTNPAAKEWCQLCRRRYAVALARAELDRGTRHPEPLRERKPEARKPQGLE